MKNRHRLGKCCISLALCIFITTAAQGSAFIECPVPRGSEKLCDSSVFMMEFQSQRFWAAVQMEETGKIEVEPEYIYIQEESGYPVEGKSRRSGENGFYDGGISFAPKILVHDRCSIISDGSELTGSKYEETLVQVYFPDEIMGKLLEQSQGWPDWSANDWLEEYEK